MKNQLFSIKKEDYQEKIPRKKAKNYALMAGIMLAFLAVMPFAGQLTTLAVSTEYKASSSTVDGETWNFNVEKDDSDSNPNAISHVSLLTCFDKDDLEPVGLGGCIG